jgi:hypothetical protein
MKVCPIQYPNIKDTLALDATNFMTMSSLDPDIDHLGKEAVLREE